MAIVASACAARGGGAGSMAPDTVRIVDTVRSGTADLGRQVTQLQLQLLERDAQLEDLRAQLDDARREVVRAMARLQTLATRAEAAAGMAEAEVAVRQLRTVDGAGVPQAQRLLELASAEFDQQNYGGALYLASEAKKIAGGGARAVAGPAERRPGEVPFAVPLRLHTLTRTNVRSGPGTRFSVLFTLESGVPVVASSHVDEWLRVTDASGRSGWVFHTLVEARR